MNTFRDELGLRPDPKDPAQVEAQAESLGLFQSGKAQKEVFRMLQQRLYERKQRSLELQTQSRE